jgi:glutathione S-transferase
LPKGPVPWFIRPIVRRISTLAQTAYINPQITLHLDFLEGELGKSEWFAGSDFSVADIQMSYPIEAASTRGGLDASRSKLWNYLQRIHARPAYQRAVAQGGDYADMT